MIDNIYQDYVFRKRRNAMMAGATVIPFFAQLILMIVLWENIDVTLEGFDVFIRVFLVIGVPSVLLAMMITYFFLNSRKEIVPRFDLGLVLIPLIIGIFSTIIVGVLGFIFLLYLPD